METESVHPAVDILTHSRIREGQHSNLCKHASILAYFAVFLTLSNNIQGLYLTIGHNHVFRILSYSLLTYDFTLYGL